MENIKVETYKTFKEKINIQKRNSKIKWEDLGNGVMMGRDYFHEEDGFYVR